MEDIQLRLILLGFSVKIKSQFNNEPNPYVSIGHGKHDKINPIPDIELLAQRTQGWVSERMATARLRSWWGALCFHWHSIGQTHPYYAKREESFS